MSEEQEQPRSFKVEDRRRFSESGDPRQESAPSEPAQASQPQAPPEHPTSGAHPELTFTTFVLSLSTQALAQLGEIPSPVDGQTVKDLGAAKQLIDILGLLSEKTMGNLDAAETQLLQNVLFDLRLKYVEVMRRG